MSVTDFVPGFPTPKAPVKYDWKVTVKKVLTIGLGAMAIYVSADPDLTPAILEALPANLRMAGAILIPMIWKAISNWAKNIGN